MHGGVLWLSQVGVFAVPGSFSLVHTAFALSYGLSASFWFKSCLHVCGGELGLYPHAHPGALYPRCIRTFLRELRDYQGVIKMMDESAEELCKEYARKHIEARLVKALDALKGAGGVLRASYCVGLGHAGVFVGPVYGQNPR